MLKANEIPEYLSRYIVQQTPSLYTPMDHASWRFILKLSKAYYSKHAHSKYLDGLEETGISAEEIPLISTMDQALQKFGWHAVAVSGFIPPAVFMEFLARGILPIACDMRQIEHLAYTPAPDIVHEAAGHAPIIADPEYAKYLRNYGELSEKSIYSKQDLEVYEAVRCLSDIKENPASTAEQISEAEKRLETAVASVDHVSEASQLARMAWWTIEYGMIGDLQNPKIYGAGLLSSVGESFHCFDPKVKKIPFSIDCIDVNYDITRPQPQLFVARDFQSLSNSLEDLAKKMAFRIGGALALDRAVQAATATTSVLDSGLQISGTLASYLRDSSSERGRGGVPSYLKFQGPTQLSFRNLQLDNQGADYHREGFGCPVGLLKSGTSPDKLSESELRALGFTSGKLGRLEFASGVVVEGELTDRTEREGRTLILTFKNCTVRQGDQILFQPDWGMFDMGCGTSVVSVFGGAADRTQYLHTTDGLKQPVGKPKTNLTDSNRALNELYKRVRTLRKSAHAGSIENELDAIHAELDAKHEGDWLLRYELLELLALNKITNAAWKPSVLKRLAEISSTSKEKSELIARGLELL